MITPANRPSYSGDTKPFVWAGISLAIPSEWETGQLGEGYALLEYRFRPAMELKTAPIRGRFSFPRHLKQLTRSGLNPSPPPVKQIPPPAEWPDFPPEAELACFSWKGDHLSGQGLLYYCRQCCRATLLQFYDPVGDMAPRVLASFKDHDTQSGPTFAVYDIAAVLPEAYRLTRFAFNAGRFELVFSHAGAVVTLWRWSPADVLLARAKGHLTPIVQANGLLPAVAAQDPGHPVEQGLEWRWPNSSWRNRLGRLRTASAPPVNALRIWHRPDANRILAVGAEGVAEGDIFDRICRSYGII